MMGPKPKPEAARFFTKVQFTESCWIWEAQVMPNGYGKFRVGSSTDGTRRHVLPHRWAYEFCVGPIPDGLQIDHLCRVRNCVNPDHLEPVTCAENLCRGTRRITSCPQGHPYDDENTYVYRGNRQCLTCRRRRALEQYYNKLTPKGDLILKETKTE